MYHTHKTPGQTVSHLGLLRRDLEVMMYSFGTKAKAINFHTKVLLPWSLWYACWSPKDSLSLFFFSCMNRQRVGTCFISSPLLKKCINNCQVKADFTLRHPGNGGGKQKLVSVLQAKPINDYHQLLSTCLPPNQLTKFIAIFYLLKFKHKSAFQKISTIYIVSS